MKSRPWLPILLTLAALAALSLACDGAAARITPAPSIPPAPPDFSAGETAYGFFPTPPRASLASILDHFAALGEHADFVLFQNNVPWEAFVGGIPGDLPVLKNQRDSVELARRNGLVPFFVIDPLNGLNRREFLGLPAGWEPAFGNPAVRSAITNYTLWVVREFQPHYLGLASEINTYLDAHPQDGANFLDLYRELYDRVKAEAPDTQVFVTFQWEDLNNLIPQASEGRAAYDTNWDQVEAFEPRLDLWAISSYPFIIFDRGVDLPADYYTPLLERTSKPLAVAEGGWSSQPVAFARGDEDGQLAYLQALHGQLGPRLAFWTYLLLDDLDMDSIGPNALENGISPGDLETLSLFAHIGLRSVDGAPKPALAAWDGYREGR